MNKKILPLLTSLALTVTLVGCNPSNNNDDGEFGEDEVAEELTLPTNVTHYTLDETDYDSLSEQATDTIRVFYRRNDVTDDYANYIGWRIWAWDKQGGNGWWYEFTKYNAYGVICEIPVSAVAANGTSISKLGMVVTNCASQTATWEGAYNKDPNCDLDAEIAAMNPGGIQRLYVKTATESVFYTQESVFMSSMSYAKLNDMKTVRPVFYTSNKDFQLYKKRFTITKNGVEANNFKIEDFKITKSGGSYQVAANLVFDKEFALNDAVVVKYRVAANYYPTCVANLVSIYDSADFNTKYSYTGNDLGAKLDSETAPTKTTFKVWSPVSSEMVLNVYNTGDYETETQPAATYPMTLGEKGVWSVVVNQNLTNKYYTYTATNSAGTNEVVDPYAKSSGVNGRRGMVVNFSQINSEITGWAADQRYNYGNPTDASIYEMHIRDMTINPNSGVSAANRGKYLGLTETGTTYTENGKTVSTGLDHLEELGITHVQIQPTYDYSSVDERNVPADMSATNYNWGYDPLNYNCLEGSYSSDPYDGVARIKEFKQMIMALHGKNINAIMDVVYNHTSGFSDSNFEKLMPLYYHRTKGSGTAYNGSGCGNEMATDRFMVNKFVRESCKFFTDEYHLSGFRFDLMGLIDNQTMIDVYNDCKAIDNRILVFGEPWTGGSSKLSGGTTADDLKNQQTNQNSLAQSFFAGNNVLVGAFCDGFRNAARGDNGPGTGYVQGVAANGASLLPGIKGQFNANQSSVQPSQVINYVSCHDNYTLYDQLIQTLPNNRDFKMAYTQAESLVFLAEGIPFLQEGEEFMRSKAYEVEGETKYSGNSYNVGDFINNMDYSLKVANEDTNNYFKDLIALRKQVAALRLNSRNEVNSVMSGLTSVNGLISYKLTLSGETYVVYHACNAATINLDASYKVLLTNDSNLNIGSSYQMLNLAANGSVILKAN